MKESACEEAILRRLADWAAGQELVRAVILESSRAREGAELDIFSDYDVLLALADTQPFVEGEAWLCGFGEPLVLFRDAFETWGHPTYTRLALYADGTKIDYLLWPVALLREVAASQKLPDVLDWGYRALLDKDGLTEGLPAPSRTAHIPARPTEAEYLALVESFWWETTYVAKNLWRDDVMHAKYNLDVVLRHELLLRLLEWRIEVDRDWTWKPGIVGRGLKRALAPATWAELAATWVGAGVEENWGALFAMTALFRRVAIEVGRSLGYTYPDSLDSGVIAYLERVRATPH
jgi:aminoglycoside 6-adenylyltransferase